MAGRLPFLLEPALVLIILQFDSPSYLLSDGGRGKDFGQAPISNPAAKGMAQDQAQRNFGPKLGFPGNTIKRVDKVMSKQERAIQTKIFRRRQEKAERRDWRGIDVIDLTSGLS